MSLCLCSNPQVYYDAPPLCNSQDCIKMPHVYIEQKDSIYPCGQTLTIDLTDKIIFDSNQDKANAEFTIESQSANLISIAWVVSADRSSIQLNVTSNYDPEVEGSSYKFAKLSYGVRQGILKDIKTITIPFKSYCSNINIPANQVCDPCDGTLSAILPNLIIE